MASTLKPTLQCDMNVRKNPFRVWRCAAFSPTLHAQRRRALIRRFPACLLVTLSFQFIGSAPRARYRLHAASDPLDTSPRD